MRIKEPTKEMDCEDAIKCIFNLNERDIQIFKKLRETGEINASDLAKKVGKERSTVYRSLQKLEKCGMCVKETKTLDRGGYYHIYKCSQTEKIKNKAKKCLNQWHQDMIKKIEMLNQ
ncbi:MAG: helix-turn-helix domain-containing protein [Candidatus Thermoplasmatota archaeon]